MIGITENGDASIDYSWEAQADSMDMMVLITKNITDEFIKRVIPFRNKTIVHATCTGYGGTVLEPNVPKWQDQIEQAKKLIASGFPAEQIVVRIDPIIPTAKGCKLFEQIVEAAHLYIKRFRISVIDNYKHVQVRFQKAGLPVLFHGNFAASETEFVMVDTSISRVKYRFPDIHIESCAEPLLKKTEKIGCVSLQDMQRFGIQPPKTRKKSRSTCLCESKKEMLKYNRCVFCNKHNKEVTPTDSCDIGQCASCEFVSVYGCSNRCLYCYWRT